MEILKTPILLPFYFVSYKGKTKWTSSELPSVSHWWKMEIGDGGGGKSPFVNEISKATTIVSDQRF